jgi:site-specific DNA recombinase
MDPIVFAIVYLRVSSGRQVDNTSLDEQERSCLAYCALKGWTVLRVFREEGESAKSANRSQLQEALRFCRESKPRPAYFVVYNVTRFARNVDDHTDLRRTLRGWGIKLRASTQNIGENPEEQLMEVSLAGWAQYDNAKRRQQTLNGMAARLNQGTWVFKTPLGLLNDRKKITHDPERAALVRDMLERFATGLYRKEDVRRWANERGLTTLRGKPLEPESLRRMLTNPLYCGRIVVRGEVEGAGPDWSFTTKGNFEPLISEETFDRIQAILSGRRATVTTYKRANPDFPLRQFVRCSCGKALTGSKSRSHTGAYHAYYHCAACGARIKISTLEAGFVAYLRKLNPKAIYLDAFKKAVVRVYRSKQDAALALVSKLERQLNEKLENKRKLNEAYVYGKALSAEDYRQMKEALEQEVFELRARLDESRSEELDIEAVMEQATTFLMNVAGEWDASDLDRKQRIQRVLLPSGVDYSDGSFRTQLTSPLFNLLGANGTTNSGLVALPGIEPGFED